MKRSLEKKQLKLEETKNSELLNAPRPARNAEWTEFYFSRLVDDQDPWDLKWDFDASPAETAELFRATLRYSGSDLDNYSDWRAGAGLVAILMGYHSQARELLFKKEVTERQRLAICLALKPFYLECLSKRVPNVLGHRSESAGNKQFEYLTYMFWDVSPLDGLVSVRTPNGTKCALVECLRQLLLEPKLNPACMESILHGLGHMVFSHRDSHLKPEIEVAIDDYIRLRSGDRAELVQYARAARTGCIQ